jgi:hypothetical protein
METLPKSLVEKHVPEHSLKGFRVVCRPTGSYPETGFGEVSDRSSGRFVGNAEVGFLLAQTIADYAKLSLSDDQPIMLALKKFIPLLRCGTLHKDGRRITCGMD